jgi:hypothetical protein
MMLSSGIRRLASTTLSGVGNVGCRGYRGRARCWVLRDRRARLVTVGSDGFSDSCRVAGTEVLLLGGVPTVC